MIVARRSSTRAKTSLSWWSPLISWSWLRWRCCDDLQLALASVNIYGSNERATEENDHISNFNKSINSHRNEFLKNLVNVRHIICAVANIFTAFAATPLSLIDSLSNTMDHGYVRRRLPSMDHMHTHLRSSVYIWNICQLSVSSNVRCKNVFKLNFIRHRRSNVRETKTGIMMATIHGPKTSSHQPKGSQSSMRHTLWRRSDQIDWSSWIMYGL